MPWSGAKRFRNSCSGRRGARQGQAEGWGQSAGWFVNRRRCRRWAQPGRGRAIPAPGGRLPAARPLPRHPHLLARLRRLLQHRGAAVYAAAGAGAPEAAGCLPQHAEIRVLQRGPVGVAPPSEMAESRMARGASVLAHAAPKLLQDPAMNRTRQWWGWGRPECPDRQQGEELLRRKAGNGSFLC